MPQTSSNNPKCKIVEHGSPAYWDTVALRDEILRIPLGLELSSEELAAESDSHHLACYDAGRLIACLVLKPLGGGKVRLRQMSVAISHQKKGIGTLLMQFAESYAREHGYTQIVMHARASAVSFYEKLGYTKQGDSFIEVTIPHFFMHKDIEKHY
ncbi:MAG: GNAT family N-acetyltransferase [bacterium]